MTETTQKWIFQCEAKRYGERYTPVPFWDTYLHKGCHIIMTSNHGPKEKEKEEEK